MGNPARNNMRVDRIIFLLLGFIAIEKSKTAPSISLIEESTCEKTKSKWIFLLKPEAKDTNTLKELVESTRSATIVKKSGNINFDFSVVVDNEDFQVFKEKSEKMKIYRSHDFQCIDSSFSKTSIGILSVMENSTRSTMSNLINDSLDSLDFGGGSKPIVKKNSTKISSLNNVEKNLEIKDKSVRKWRTSGTTKNANITNNYKNGNEIKWEILENLSGENKRIKNDGKNNSNVTKKYNGGGNFPTRKTNISTGNETMNNSEETKKWETRFSSETLNLWKKIFPANASINELQKLSSNLEKLKTTTLKNENQRNSKIDLSVEETKNLKMPITNNVITTKNSPIARNPKLWIEEFWKSKDISKSEFLKKSAIFRDSVLRKLITDLVENHEENHNCGTDIDCQRKRSVRIIRDKSNYKSTQFPTSKSKSNCPIIKISDCKASINVGKITISLHDLSGCKTDSNGVSENFPTVDYNPEIEEISPADLEILENEDAELGSLENEKELIVVQPENENVDLANPEMVSSEAATGNDNNDDENNDYGNNDDDDNNNDDQYDGDYDEKEEEAPAITLPIKNESNISPESDKNLPTSSTNSDGLKNNDNIEYNLVTEDYDNEENYKNAEEDYIAQNPEILHKKEKRKKK